MSEIINSAHSVELLEELRSKTLEDKIALTKLRIMEFYEHYEGNVIVGFSGGKDSTVLLHLVRSLYPEVKAVYCDTGLEYPEVKEHIKQVDNVDIIRPKMSFKEVLDKYGWVVPSKIVSRKIYYAKLGSQWAINTLKGLNKDGSLSNYCKRYKKWAYLVDAPFKISDKCCDIMKKRPIAEYVRTNGVKGRYIGTLTEESELRKNAWVLTGCNAFDSGHSKPLSFWTEQDILRYIKENNISIPTIYGKIIENNGKLSLTGESRTGCMFCPIGVHLEKYPNRFQRMAGTHPKIYDYCLNKLGLKEVLDYIGVEYRPRDVQLMLFKEF